jgi:hypothetical protein
MDKFQPTMMLPMARPAHIPERPQELPLALADTPLPEPMLHIQPAAASPAAMLGRQLMQRRLQTFRPASRLIGDEPYTFPIRRLAAAPGRPPETTRQASRAGIPRTPPCSIPGYFTSKTTLREPRLGEALLGCGTLLLACMLVLALLYYLSL